MLLDPRPNPFVATSSLEIQKRRKVKLKSGPRELLHNEKESRLESAYYNTEEMERPQGRTRKLIRKVKKSKKDLHDSVQIPWKNNFPDEVPATLTSAMVVQMEKGGRGTPVENKRSKSPDGRYFSGISEESRGEYRSVIYICLFNSD